MKFSKLIASILETQLKSFSFLRIISYIEITIEFLKDLGIRWRHNYVIMTSYTTAWMLISYWMLIFLIFLATYDIYG